MACPYFEPRELLTAPRRRSARLPLIGEYSGVCHACAASVELPRELVSTACNQGYADSCPRYPVTEKRSAMRYSVTAQTEFDLTILWIEEADYTPVRTGRVIFDIRAGQAIGDLPLPAAAQLEAFCKSYLALARGASNHC